MIVSLLIVQLMLAGWNTFMIVNNVNGVMPYMFLPVNIAGIILCMMMLWRDS